MIENTVTADSKPLIRASYMMDMAVMGWYFAINPIISVTSLAYRNVPDNDRIGLRLLIRAITY